MSGGFAQKTLYRGTSLIRKCPPPLGTPQGPRHRPTVGSYGGAVSYERGTPVGCGVFTCAAQEAGSYFRLIDFVYHSTLGLRVMKKREEEECGVLTCAAQEAKGVARVLRRRVASICET